MKRKIWLALVGLILSFLLVAPVLGQTKEKAEDHWGNYHAMKREKLVKELKLTPEKAKEFQAVSEKFHKSRKEIFAAMEKGKDELQTVMAAAKPDEAKIKGLVSTITGEQDKLLNSFKAQRDAELARLTPEQQANYLLVLAKWHQERMKEMKEQGKEMMKEHGKHEMMEKKMEQKEEKK